MRKKAEEKKKAAAEAEAEQADDKKKKNKKVKEVPTKIQYGKGTRAFYDYLRELEKECGMDEAVFLQRLNYF